MDDVKGVDQILAEVLGQLDNKVMKTKVVRDNLYALVSEQWLAHS